MNFFANNAIDRQRWQSSLSGFTNVLGSIGQFVQKQKQAKATAAYYDAVNQAKQQSIQNAIVAERATADSVLRLAEIKAQAMERNADILYANAINQAQAGFRDFMQGNRVAAYRIGKAKAAFGASGAAQSGTVVTKMTNIADQSFRDVDNQFRDSVNRVNNFLAESAQQEYAAALERYGAEEENRLRRITVAQQLGVAEI